MRRPQSLDWTPHHTYCCQALTEGSQPADLRLVQIAELLKLSQDVSKTFCYDTKPKSIFLYFKTNSRTLRSIGLSHGKRLPPTTRTLAGPKPHSRRIRKYLVSSYKSLPPRGFSPQFPQHRRLTTPLWIQRPRRTNALHIRPNGLSSPCRLYFQNSLFSTKITRSYISTSLSR
jgi:hypothetical protein